MIERMTARAFRARFHKVTDPVLVGNGIWFPEATAALLGYAEPVERGPDITMADGTIADMKTAIDTPAFDAIPRQPAVGIKHDLSKQTQAKGRMRK